MPALSAEENVFLGMTPKIGGFVDRRTMRRRYLELCRRLNVNIPPSVVAKDLSVADGQLLEIMRALAAEARIILLDEPTAALSVAERNTLLKIVRELRSQGVTMVFISHNLEEVLSVADHVTVLRDGTVADSGRVSEWTRERLVRAMLGDKAKSLAKQLLDEDDGDSTNEQPAAPAVACHADKPGDSRSDRRDVEGPDLRYQYRRSPRRDRRPRRRGRIGSLDFDALSGGR